MNQVSIFEYVYRDASNFKPWGGVVLDDAATPTQVARLRSCFDAGNFFIAEQLGLPPLYEELWTFSGGPTDGDHVWHTFHALRPVQPDETHGAAFDSVENFIVCVEAIAFWDGSLSPHWDL